MKPVYKDLFFSGTSNLVLPVANKQAYPPEFQDKSRLIYYASLFNSVEINRSFYKIPMASTVKKWADSVPDNFRFTFKLWRDITHNKALVYNTADVAHFMQTIAHIGDKKGCLLIQFPPGITVANARQLESLLQDIQLHNTMFPWKVAIEFRHRSWYREDIYHLLNQHQAVMVLHDMPASANMVPDATGEIVYLRFHGPNGGYRGSYTDDFLYEYAQYMMDWMTEGKTVYVYFNNTMGDAVKNLMTLNRYVGWFQK